MTEKTDSEKITALQLLKHLTEETRLAIFRDLNRVREESFIRIPAPGSSFEDYRNDERLKMLEAIEEEQREEAREQAKRPPRMLD